MMETAKEQLKRHEGGPYLKPYRDSENNFTIGWGHLLVDGITITRRVAQQLFDDDYHVAQFNFLSLGINNLTRTRQNVLVNMLFNLGLPRFLTFKKMIKALEDQDYEKAADEMLKSKWHKQVKGRAVELAGQMREG